MTTILDKVALISPLEQNKTVVAWDNKLHKRYFEQEAVRMAQSWRKHGGWLKDIDIHFYNVNNAKLAEGTIKQLEELRCCIHSSNESNDQYNDIGFMTEPKCGFLAEQSLDKDIFIKTDLDMQLISPLDRSLVEQAFDNVMIEQYSDFDKKEQRDSIGNFNPFDTCFIMSSKKSHFYQTYLSLCSSDEILQNKDWLKLQQQNGFYYIEEFVVDYMYNNNIGMQKIKPMQSHLYGEGYKQIELMTDDEIRSIRFMHYHAYLENNDSNSIAQKQAYARRISQILLKGKGISK